MYKFTIFSIIVSMIIVMVVFTFVITDFRAPTGEGEISLDTETSTDKVPVKISAELDADLRFARTLTDAFWFTAEITIEDITFEDFKKPLFGFITAHQSETQRTIQYVITKEGFENAQAFELISENEETALNLYKVIKESVPPAFTINETNDFGDEQSFYINRNDESEQVFLIIKRKHVIYAFAYSKEAHNLFVPLLNALP